MRLSETEVIYAVKQIEMGISIREIARKYGVCEKTIPFRVLFWRGNAFA